MGMKVLALLSIFLSVVYGDVYMQNMKGSNNRLDNQARDRRNDRRLFDSQNNARGGYNTGRAMEYYVGSTLRLEWTNQHSCGNVNCNCEIIVQYMCGDDIRDGSSEDTIPEYHDECEKRDCTTDLRFGMHESNEYYETCKFTKRNDRLFTANRRRHPTARSTRQNENADRYGYECPEERDYYPYWRHSPWKDIVIMTNDTSRCEYYLKNSQNNISRHYCKPPPGYFEYIRRYGDRHDDAKYIPITREECEELTIPGNEEAGTGQWIEVAPHNIPEAACEKTQISRGNHNGNGPDGVTHWYDWTIPDDVHDHCVLRMRYNISTNDFDSWESTAKDNEAPIYKAMGMYETLAEETDYSFTNNPVIRPFRVLENGQNIGYKFKLKLAVDTRQFGRTFQDRSHAFSIKPRPDIDPAATIVNVNVRGKRGNIVQTYPATEYDFVPNTLRVKCNVTYIHFQWTGSDENNGGNAGQGRDRTDRSNVCLMGKSKYRKEGDNAGDIKHGHYGSSFPADMNEGTNFLRMDDESEKMLCSSGFVNGNNEELDEAGIYYNHAHHVKKDGGLLKCRCEEGTIKHSSDGLEIHANVNGVWYYMCTRNNNFTNRSHKAKIICE